MGSSQSSSQATGVRRQSKEYPLNFSPQERVRFFKTLYWQEREKLVDISNSLDKILWEQKKIEGEERKQRRDANWTLVAGGALGLGGFYTSFLAAAGAAVGLVGLILHLRNWIQHRKRPAALERQKQSNIMEFEDTLMSLKDRLEQLEDDIIEMRRWTVLQSLSEVQSSINNLYRDVRTSGEISESLLEQTLSELDAFVNLL